MLLTNDIEMHPRDIPFDQIKRGKKMVEVRLYDEKRSKIQMGDGILFYKLDFSDLISAQVTVLHWRSSFRELFEMPDMLVKAEFIGVSLAEAVQCMRQHYTEEQERAMAFSALNW